MDDQGDDWGDTLAGFAIGDLSLEQRQTLSSDLAEAGILHAFVGAELQGPAAESELIEHLVAQTRRSGGRRPSRPNDLVPADRPGSTGPLPRALRLPWGAVPLEALGLPIASRWRRFGGFLVEALGFGLMSEIIYRYSAGGAQLFVLGTTLLSGVVLVAVFGATVGMMVLRMRVVPLASPDAAAPGWNVALVRFLVAGWPDLLRMGLTPFFSFEDLAWLASVTQVWLIVCFGPILLDPAHRGLHDRVARTVVVDLPRRRGPVAPAG